MTRAHPNLNENYFDRIDTKTKAYWLGMLYADGHIDDHKPPKKVVLTANKKDEGIINSFIEAISANKEKKEYIENYVRIRIGNDKICDMLMKHGCVPRKSKIIELPKLKNQELYLAFLLGYYDGDGTQNKTRITTGSKKFIQQIKEKFHIKWNINKKKSKGTSYVMCLGTILFNEMMDNYENSLPRKRKRFCTKKERARKAMVASKNNSGKKKFEVTKDRLENIVWEIPTTKIAELFGVSDKAIAKRCKKFGIEKPSRGYWNKHRTDFHRRQTEQQSNITKRRSSDDQ